MNWESIFRRKATDVDTALKEHSVRQSGVYGRRRRGSQGANNRADQARA